MENGTNCYFIPINDTNINNGRVDDCLCNSYPTTHVDIMGNKNFNEPNNDVDSNNNINININIYRYKFLDDFTSELYKFSKIHQYDHRRDFKEAWSIWLDNNDEIVTTEVRRLTNLGYDGDILDKMFKSARYYFRKKSTEKKTPKQRRNYIGVQKNLLDAMDEHIKIAIKNDDYKPSEGFDLFCKEHVDMLKEEVNILYKNGFTDSDEIKQKIKKTYKNRYFLIIS